MEVQLGNPIVRNNLILLDSSPPFLADDSLHHVAQQNNWYFKVNEPDLEYFPATAAGNGDPKLVDYMNGDYNLTENSPLKGRGINLSSQYDVDFLGNPLPTSGSWDIGAIQFIKLSNTKEKLNEK